MSAVACSVMLEDFDLHPIHYRSVQAPMAVLREDPESRRAYVDALAETLQGLDVRALGFLLEAERASARRARVKVPKEVWDDAARLQRLVRELQRDAGTSPEDYQPIADTEEERQLLVQHSIDLFCALVGDFYELVRGSESWLKWLPELAGLLEPQGCRWEGLRHSSAHGVLCKFGLRVANCLRVAPGTGGTPACVDVDIDPGRGDDVTIDGPMDLEIVERDILISLGTHPELGLSKQINTRQNRSPSTIRRHIRPMRELGLIVGEEPYVLTKKGQEWGKLLVQMED